MLVDNFDLDLTPAEKTRIEIHATEILVNVGILTSVMHVAVIALVSVVLWSDANTNLLLLWTISTSIVVIFQGSINHRYIGQTLTSPQAKSILARYEISALLVAATWGAAGFFLFPEHDQAKTFFSFS